MKQIFARAQTLRRFFGMLVVLAIFSISLLTSCGGSGENSAGPKFLSIGTAPSGGAFFVMGNTFAQVANQHGSAFGWQVSSEATKGTQENIRRIEKGELDFGMANAAISYFAVRGEGAWQTPHQIRTVMTLAPNVAQFITPGNSGIKSIADMKGKRIVVGPAGAGFEYFLQPILAAHGVSYEDFTPLNSGQGGSVELLADGSADAAFLGGAVPTPSIVQASAGRDIFFIPYDETAKAELFKNYPFFAPATIPAKTYSGQNEAYAGMNVGNMHLICGASLDDETVYQFTKTIYEQRAEVVKGHPAGRAINPNNVIRNTGTPFHPGAIRYYKEIGIWPES